MARIHIVPREAWEIIREYLEDPGAILIPETSLDSFPDEKAAQLREIAECGDAPDYNFGGEPDVCIDIIHCPTSYAAEYLLGDTDSEEEVCDNE